MKFSPHGRVSQSYYDPGKNFPDPGCAAYMYGGFDTNPKFNVGRSYERTGKKIKSHWKLHLSFNNLNILKSA